MHLELIIFLPKKYQYTCIQDIDRWGIDVIY